VDTLADKPGAEGKPAQKFKVVKQQAQTKYAGVGFGLWSTPFPILNPCVLLCDECVGSDKLGHFLQQGAEYARVAAQAGKKAAEKWNTDTEYIDKIADPMGFRTGGYGEATTGVMSKADMEANRQGGQFYTDLDKAMKAGAAFNFDICRYVNGNWSEENNPNDYVPQVGAQVQKNLAGTGRR
jgi:hypothetical protein